MTTVAAILLGLLLAAGLIVMILGWNGWPSPRRRQRRAGSKRITASDRNRMMTAAGVALAVALLTRWPVAVVAAAALIVAWPRLFGAGKDARAQIARLEALATWTESLRDTMAAVSLEQAIGSTAATAPDAIRPSLQLLAGRVAGKVPLPQALAAFADEYDDPSVDLVVAALVMNAKLRGPGLPVTLSALAQATRDELDMRRKVEESRKVLRRDAQIIIGLTVGIAALIAVFSRDYVAPFATTGGQAALTMVLAIFAAGLLWMRHAAAAPEPERFLADTDELARVGS